MIQPMYYRAACRSPRTALTAHSVYVGYPRQSDSVPQSKCAVGGGRNDRLENFCYDGLNRLIKTVQHNSQQKNTMIQVTAVT